MNGTMELIAMEFSPTYPHRFTSDDSGRLVTSQSGKVLLQPTFQITAAKVKIKITLCVCVFGGEGSEYNINSKHSILT